MRIAMAVSASVGKWIEGALSSDAAADTAQSDYERSHRERKEAAERATAAALSNDPVDSLPSEPADPTAEIFKPRMPEVEIVPNPEQLFATVRRLAVGLEPDPAGEEPPADAQGRAVIVVTPGGQAMAFEIPPGALPPEHADSGAAVLPTIPRKHVAVISYTHVPALLADPDICIPFLGFLRNFAYRGHIVWVFEGHSSRLAAGCRHADLLLLDWGMLPFLQPDWKDVVSGVMRGNAIWIHDRERYQLIQTTLDNVQTHHGGALISFKQPPTVLGGE